MSTTRRRGRLVPSVLAFGGAPLATVLILIASTPVCPLHAATLPDDFIPRVRVVRHEQATVLLADSVVVESDQPSEDAYAISVLRKLTEELGVARNTGKASVGIDRITLRTGEPGDVPAGTVADQSYSIDVRARRVLISGPTAAARLYGAETLCQLGRMNRRLPIGVISDGPALAVRGFSLDISRGRMPSHADFISLLDLCASFKLNHLLIYIEDTFPFSRVPAEARRGYGLSRQQLRELADQAAYRSITLVPILQTLGHQERLLSHPSMWVHSESAAPPDAWRRALLGARALVEKLLARYGPRPSARMTGAQFAVTEKETQGLVESMVDDVLEASGAANLHIGCDEPTELGMGASKALSQRQGVEQIFIDHVRRLSTRITERWKARTWIFNDFVLEHPAVLDSLPLDLILVDWRKYDPAADYSSLAALEPQARSRVLTSPGLWNWFAIVPAYRRALVNIERATGAAKQNGCLGSVLASWGDGGAEDLMGNDIAGLAYFADCSWATAEPSREAFVRAYCRIRFGDSGAIAQPAYAALLDLEIPDLVYSQRLVYRPIMLRRRTPRWLDAMSSVGEAVATASRPLGNVRPKDTYAAAELQAIQSGLDRLDAAIRREQALDSLTTDLLSSQAGVKAPLLAHAAATLSRLAQHERRSQRAFEKAWRDHNEESELETVRRRFTAQLRDLDSLRMCAERGTLTVPARYR